MKTLLSMHVIPVHGRPEDIAYAQALDPAVLKFVDADPHRVAQFRAVCPDAWVILRDWSLSEQKGDMRADPVATGRRHAAEWAARAEAYAIPPELLLVCGINEPEVWLDMSCVPYTVAFLDALHTRGLRGLALNLSVGWPANTGEGTPPDWTPFLPVYDAIRRGNHVLGLHEYWDERGPDYNWGWWAGRYTKCPWDVPIVMGECGIDKYVSDPSVDANRRGWQGWMNAEQYAAQVRRYAERCSTDSRVRGLTLYTTDYSHPWSSFDTLPAHGPLAGVQVPPQAQGPHVAAPAGVNVRAVPSTTGAVLYTLPFMAPVTPVGRTVDSWLLLDDGGWVSGMWIAGWSDDLPLVPAPVPDEPDVFLPIVSGGGEPHSDDFERVMEFVLNWEGGYQNIASDPGNWTGGKQGVGVQKGTKYGISAASYPHLDIANLTLDQAKDIYKRDYWQKSGADALPWPANLIMMDTAVLHGVGTATRWMAESGPDPLAFAAKRLRSYTSMGHWDDWGRAWTKRVADLLEESVEP